MATRRDRVRQAAVVAVMGVVFATSNAVAGTGIGAVMNLGETNTVNARTMLDGTVDASQFAVINRSSGASAAGIGISVPAGKPPLRVNASAGKATNLNADALDGLDSTSFVQGTGSVRTYRDYVRIDGNQSMYGGVPGTYFRYHCLNATHGQDIVYLINGGSRYVDYWFDDGRSNPTYGVVSPEHRSDYFHAVKAGDRLTWWLGNGSTVAQVTMVTVNIGSNCLHQAWLSTTERPERLEW